MCQTQRSRFWSFGFILPAEKFRQSSFFNGVNAATSEEDRWRVSTLHRGHPFGACARLYLL